MEPQKKSDLVRQLVQRGDYKAAMRIAKSFRLGISREDSDAMKLAYECMVHDRTYAQMGYNIDQSIKVGTFVLKKLYGGRGA